MICARERVCWAIHIAAPPAVVSDIARRLEAPRILEIREKRDGSWVKGAQLFCRDLEGRVTSTLEADTFFDEAPLPALASSWRSTREERHRLSANWDKDPEILKEEMFGEWQERRPKGTQEQFELEWGLVTAVFGI